MREVLLSGEHASLPEAELRALLAVHDPTAVVERHGLLASIDCGPEGDIALARMALLHAWGEPWGRDIDSPEGLEHLAHIVRRQAPGGLPAAVVSERRGTNKSANAMAVERALGAALKDAGHPIDLARPDLALYAWLLDGRIHCGRLMGTGLRTSYEARLPESRAHFSPVGLHPRRAATLVHLARVQPGGIVYDPFCGTGGIALEAAREGYRVLASDLDPFMVQGTLQTLTDTLESPLDAEAFVCDIGRAPDLVDPVDGIATDLPYGRASGTEGEALEPLYARTFRAFLDLLRPGARAVVGHARADLVSALPEGLVLEEVHEERVHGSLTRRFAVVKRLQEVAA